jgi:hypothetical protein
MAQNFICTSALWLKSWNFPHSMHMRIKKMKDLVTVQFVQPLRLADLTDCTFAPRDSELRACQDKEGWMQKLLVAAILYLEGKHWS